MRLKVIALRRNLIEAVIIVRKWMWRKVFNWRIPSFPNYFPFQLKPTQFLVTLCFLLTINESRGQILRPIGMVYTYEPIVLYIVSLCSMQL